MLNMVKFFAISTRTATRLAQSNLMNCRVKSILAGRFDFFLLTQTETVPKVLIETVTSVKTISARVHLIQLVRDLRVS